VRALAWQLSISLRLHFRNRMALLYSYLFPTMFLVAFWTLYRFEQVPLIRHLGEFLTITVLGGACFGLPTTMVAERERGVWRRYRLAPVSSANLVASTMAARYVLLVVAGLLQLVLALGLGMPAPRHPLELVVAFTAVAFAFIGLGLVIAMLADNVPAVQALGQCVFLPMLIVGGVAVPLASLPAWAQHVSAFLPGRYAVQAIQACGNGDGLPAAGFSLFALVGIGAAGSLAGAKLFRWDRDQRFAAIPGKGWLAVALAAWVVVGLAAEMGGSAPPVAPGAMTGVSSPAPEPTEAAPPAPAPPADAATEVQPAPAPPPSADPAARPGAPDETTKTAPRAEAPPETAVAPPEPLAEAPDEPPLVPEAPPSWQSVTRADIDRDLVFDRLPPDGGVVTPIAGPGQYPDQAVADEVAAIAEALLAWLPGHVADPVQRARNLLFAAAVVDVAQQPMEPYLPEVVFEELRNRMPASELMKVLYWIAIYPERGTVPTPSEFAAAGLRQVPPDEEELRNRAAIYGVKLLGRLTGRIR
jgi:ABC-2 type transport system permease protein